MPFEKITPASRTRNIEVITDEAAAHLLVGHVRHVEQAMEAMRNNPFGMIKADGCELRFHPDEGVAMTEQQALARIISNLQQQGWNPSRVWDGEESVEAKGKTTEEIVEECAAIEQAYLSFRRGQDLGQVMMVWGNSPSELIADHTENNGVGAAVDAALLSVWPTYPDVED